eukprot:14825572-Heterocapsa_arctica.AAC.1
MSHKARRGCEVRQEAQVDEIGHGDDGPRDIAHDETKIESLVVPCRTSKASDAVDGERRAGSSDCVRKVTFSHRRPLAPLSWA